MPDQQCNCNDEFVTGPCPIHAPDQGMAFGKEMVVVNDQYISSPQMVVWTGFTFVCPACQQPAIMVNKDLGKFCAYCGQPVVVQSKTVTDYVRRIPNE